MVTKTQKKKEERKVEQPRPATKVNTAQMGEGGFNVVNNQRPQTASRGGRGGRGGEGRGRGGEGRGGGRGRGGGERNDDRPRTSGNRPPRLDAEGNPIRGGRGGRGAARGGDRGGRGNFTGEGKEGDRKDKTGVARRGDKKDGEGRANWGNEGDRQYKKKSVEEGEAVAEAVEEVKTPKEPEVQYIEEIIGYSLDDYFKTSNAAAGKKEARKADGIKGEKVAENALDKTHQETVL